MPTCTSPLTPNTPLIYQPRFLSIYTPPLLFYLQIVLYPVLIALATNAYMHFSSNAARETAVRDAAKGAAVRVEFQKRDTPPPRRSFTAIAARRSMRMITGESRGGSVRVHPKAFHTSRPPSGGVGRNPLSKEVSPSLRSEPYIYIHTHTYIYIYRANPS